MSEARFHKNQPIQDPHPRRRRQESIRQDWYGTAITLGVIAAIVGMTMRTDLFTAFNFSKQTNPPPTQQDDDALYTGSIIFNPDTIKCEKMKFDNRNGQFGDKTACDRKVVFDAHGNPIPLGTSHRLDAIKKSFLGSRD